MAYLNFVGLRFKREPFLPDDNQSEQLSYVDVSLEEPLPVTKKNFVA